MVVQPIGETVEKTYRFGALRAHSVKLKKVKQDKWNKELVGEGICAAVAMQWIGFYYGQAAEPSETIVKPLANIQHLYDMINKDLDEATKDLAEGMMLQFAPEGPSLYCGPQARADEAAEFWSEHGYSSEKLSGKIVALTRELREDLQPGESRTAFLSFKIDVDTILGLFWETTVLNYTPKQLREKKLANFVKKWEPPLHGIALAVRQENITLCDANCGIYEIEWGKEEDFFTEYEKCYKSFLKDDDDIYDRTYKTGLTSIQGIEPG
jgi:hypothetical protein